MNAKSPKWELTPGFYFPRVISAFIFSGLFAALFLGGGRLGLGLCCGFSSGLGRLQRSTQSTGPYPLGGVRSVTRVFAGVGLWHGVWFPSVFQDSK
jgi:hypothetical protein